MTTTLRLEKIGDAKGIRIPEELIQRYHIDSEVRLTETATGFLLEPAEVEKLTLEESFEEMARDEDSKKELAAWEGTLADGLDDDDFAGWPR